LYGWWRGDIGSLHGCGWLDVKGKRVLDVGVSNGDTTVSTSLSGARDRGRGPVFSNNAMRRLPKYMEAVYLPV